MTRLSAPQGFRPGKLSGMWTRQQRRYFVMSLAMQPNKDRERAKDLLAIMDRSQPSTPTDVTPA